MTLRGRGMPTVGRGRRGDQQVVLNVVVPRKLSARQQELLEELRGSLTAENLERAADESLLSQGAGERSADPARGPGAGRATPSWCSPRCSSWRPTGVEQVDGEGFVEFALYGAPGRAARAAARARRRSAACA